MHADDEDWEIIAMTDKQDDSSKNPTGTSNKAVSKRSVTKKTAARKTVEKKPTAPKKKAAKKSAAIKAETKRPAVKNKRMGGAAGRRSDDKIIPGLLQNLQGVFDKIYHDNRDQDRARDVMTRDLNIHLRRSFKTMHKELEEREKILDRKLKSIDHLHSHEIKRVKLMSVPIMMLTLVAIVYLFYVVRVMETAMSSMSQDMNQMTTYMETITQDTHALSINTAAMVSNTQDMVSNTGDMVTSVNEMNNEMKTMNTEMRTMNQNISNLNITVNNLAVDVNHMTRTVGPAMKGINKFLP